MTEFSEYLQACSEMQMTHGNAFSVGRIYWTVLSVMKPELRAVVDGDSEIDPFHDDSKVTAFYRFVKENWDAYEDRAPDIEVAA